MSTLQESLRKRRSEQITAVCCVTADERQSALIVSLWAGETWVLPWSQFVSARLDREKIDLSFGHHVVIVTGENLHALLEDIAAYRISALRELPPEYRQKPGNGEPFVLRIEVALSEGISIREPPA